MSGAIPPLPNKPTWHGALLKHRDNFTFTFYLYNGCSRSGFFFFALGGVGSKNRFVERAAREGASAWCKFHSVFIDECTAINFLKLQGRLLGGLIVLEEQICDG
jgi:hypothetical protein